MSFESEIYAKSNRDLHATESVARDLLDAARTE